MMHPDLLVSLESNAMTNAKPNTRVELTPGSDILFELLTDEVVIPEDKGVVINLLVSLKFPGTIHKIGSIVWNRAPPGFEVSIVAMNSLEFIRRGLYSKFPLLATCSSEKLEGVGSSRAFEVSFDMTPFRPLRIRWNMTCAARLQEPKRASVAEMRAQASAMLSANAAKAAVLNASSENSVGRRNDSPDPRIMRDDLAGDKQRELTKRENFSALINVCVFNVVHPEIVQAGKVQKEYNITRANFQLFALRDPRALALPIKWLDPRVSIFEASVWAGLRRTINYSGVYISSSAPDIVMGALVLPSMFSYFYMSESGGSIVDMRKLRVMCVCLDAGSAYVMVSVVLEDGSLIEFGFAKECDSPQMHQRSGQLTAVSLMNWILFCMMAASAGTLAFFVKRQSLSFNMQPSGTRYSESRFSRGPRVGTTGARPVERAGQFDTSCLKDG
ncbi:hypothetical protein FVE85_4559 [Porphyridium purpureum]|nr:hypothetical protein FVE85_4559 [Porphyridium purpureum]|eukprot:POR5512..scf225_25